jgi:hypothetical protein
VKVQLGTHVDADLKSRLKVYAVRTGQRLQDVVAEAINGYLASKDVAAGESLQPANERGPGAGTPGPQTV